MTSKPWFVALLSCRLWVEEFLYSCWSTNFQKYLSLVEKYLKTICLDMLFSYVISSKLKVATKRTRLSIGDHTCRTSCYSINQIKSFKKGRKSRSINRMQMKQTMNLASKFQQASLKAQPDKLNLQNHLLKLLINPQNHLLKLFVNLKNHLLRLRFRIIFVTRLRQKWT